MKTTLFLSHLGLIEDYEEIKWRLMKFILKGILIDNLSKLNNWTKTDFFSKTKVLKELFEN